MTANVPFVGIATSTDFPQWENEYIDSYWLINNLYTVPAIILCYLVFVTSLGPYLMTSRRPFDLKYLMMGYNIFQVGYNIWFLSLFYEELNFFPYMAEEACSPTTPSRSIHYRKFLFKVSYAWFLSKMSDLIDTVFFVLRKKHSHVSFLHLYHHTHMVLIVWLYMKYFRGEQAVMIGLVNSVVHVVMYSYYFLAALGPSVQRYLWWKKYITWFQLFQFVVLGGFYFSLVYLCPTPPLQTAYNSYAVLQGVIFTALFLNFYFKSYTKPKRKSSKVGSGTN